MASKKHSIKDAERILNDIVLHHNHAQVNVSKEYLAARTIQRWFRGYITRKHLKFLNSCATIIQRHWRGYVDRKYYYELLKIARANIKIPSYAQVFVYKEYLAARTIQRWFRGFVTRKHLKFLNSCATIIQRHWRGYVDRKYYYGLLKDAVHKLYLDHYNQMATKIQKVWRGHYVRTHIFSFYKLKTYIREVLEKNREFLKQSKSYEAHTKQSLEQRKEQDCQEMLAYLSFRAHHLIRTHHIEGIYSNRDTCEYSDFEKHLKNTKFKDHMDAQHAKVKEKLTKEPQHTYIFEGRLRECEETWQHRNDPGKYSLATGEYNKDMKDYQQSRKMSQILHWIQDRPMQFLPVRYQDGDYHLNAKTYKCPPLHGKLRARQTNDAAEIA